MHAEPALEEYGLAGRTGGPRQGRRL